MGTNLEYQLAMRERFEAFHGFLVQPVDRKGKGYVNVGDPFVFVSEHIERLDAAALRIGKIVEQQDDDSIIVEQEFTHREKDGVLQPLDKPIKARSKVSGVRLRLHVPSVDG